MPDDTWIEAEEYAYPRGGFTRRAYVQVRDNPSFPNLLPATLDGERRLVKVSIPDTYFSIPARLKVKGQTYRGYVSVDDNGAYFVPEQQ